VAATEATNASRDEAIKLAKNEGETLASAGADMNDATTNVCNRILLATIALKRLLPNSLPTTTCANKRAATRGNTSSLLRERIYWSHISWAFCCGGLGLGL